MILSACIMSAEDIVAQSAEEKLVASAVDNLIKGMLDGDRSLLEKVAADKLSYGHSGGKVESKAEFVEAIVTGKSDFTKIDVSDQKITINGNTAIVRHVLKGETVNNGATTALNIGVMLVWQKERKEWKLLGRQAFKL